jgi:hypothetical protein
MKNQKMMTAWAAENSTWAVKTITWAVPGHHLGGGFSVTQTLLNQLFKDCLGSTWVLLARHR